jgi:hypothetical protein
MLSHSAAPLPAPSLNTSDPNSPETQVVLRSGMRLPAGDAVACRALPERATQVLGQALDNAPITEAVGGWCTELSLPMLEPSRLAGYNRARHLRLVKSALADRHLVEVVAEVQLLSTDGAPSVELLFTLDILASVAPKSLDSDLQSGAQVLAGILRPTHRAPGALPRPEDLWLLRLSVFRLRALLDAILATLVDKAVVAALAGLADIDPIMMPRPPSAALRSNFAVQHLLGEDELVRIPDSDTSDGADVVAHPALDPHESAQRAAQVDLWLEQIARDAGLSGMQRLLDQLPPH